MNDNSFLSLKGKEDFMNEWEKIYEYVYHRKKVCYTTEYQSERGLKEQFREDKKKKER